MEKIGKVLEEDGLFKVYTSDLKRVLGTHKTPEGAAKQQRAIWASKRASYEKQASMTPKQDAIIKYIMRVKHDDKKLKTFINKLIMGGRQDVQTVRQQAVKNLTKQASKYDIMNIKKINHALPTKVPKDKFTWDNYLKHELKTKKKITPEIMAYNFPKNADTYSPAISAKLDKMDGSLASMTNAQLTAMAKAQQKDMNKELKNFPKLASAADQLFYIFKKEANVALRLRQAKKLRLAEQIKKTKGRERLTLNKEQRSIRGTATQKERLIEKSRNARRGNKKGTDKLESAPIENMVPTTSGRTSSIQRGKGRPKLTEPSNMKVERTPSTAPIKNTSSAPIKNTSSAPIKNTSTAPSNMKVEKTPNTAPTKDTSLVSIKNTSLAPTKNTSPVPTKNTSVSTEVKSGGNRAKKLLAAAGVTTVVGAGIAFSGGNDEETK